jgi:RHS repeat-associated protein
MAQINPIRYATKYYDSETGLYYFGQRYLDPVTGQWLNREPLGENESLNLYAYTHGDPINNVDALGLQEIPLWQAHRSLWELALQCGVITEEADNDTIIDTAILNSKLTAAGQLPVEVFRGEAYRPSIVCHGRSGGGVIEGVSRLFSVVSGQVHSSANNADVTRKLGAGMWGNARALGKDIGNLGHLLWNDISYAAGETSGFDLGDFPIFYQSPFDAERSRIAGQQQVYPGISSGNLLVKSGGFMSDVLMTAGGGELVAMSFRLTSRATGWSVRAAKTGTVWDSIKATQPVWEGTTIPRSFELTTDAGKFWVHGNGTKHMAEYALGKAGSAMGTKAQLTSLQSAVQAAAGQGIQYGQMVKVGGWELIFGAPKQAGQLPAIIHALQSP